MVSLSRLPPIAALRALEAAARHLSFTKAAAELNITQSAVSHQIRHLEDLWGFQLFHRRPHGLALSEPAQRLASVLSQFFDRMDVLLGELNASDARGALRVSVTQSFAVTWLVPRLGAFREAHPEINIWISADDRLIDFSPDDADVGIRLGREPFRGLHAKLLLREYVFPVCSPRLIERFGMPSSPSDLLRFPLLLRINERHAMTWRDWFRHRASTCLSRSTGRVFQIPVWRCRLRAMGKEWRSFAVLTWETICRRAAL